MTTYSLCPAPNYRSLKLDGTPNAGGKLHTYISGTTTPQATYTSSTGGTSNANPVIFDANGFANVWLDASLTYTLLETDSADVTIRTQDVISNSVGTTGAAGTFACATATGTVDAITADYSPDLTLADKVMCAFVSLGKNTVTNPSFSPDGLTAHTITKRGGLPLLAGDIGAALTVHILEYNLANTRWELLNPIYRDSGTENTIASATTTDIGASTSKQVLISGTTTITSFGSTATTSDPVFNVRFSGALTLTHNATSLILPGAANITTADGDTLTAQYLGSGNWKVLDYYAIASKSSLLTVGTSANNLIQLDGTAKLPAVDGSQLTNVAKDYALLATATASASATLDFTSLITATYDSYVFVLSDIRAATNLVTLRIRTSTNNGSSYDTSGYNQILSEIRMDATFTESITGNGSDTGIPLVGASQMANTAAAAYNGTVEINNPLDATHAKMITHRGSYVGTATGNHYFYHGAGNRAATADIDAIRFMMDSGNITSGTIRMYGRKA